jgi:ribose 5-phosphate isomerase RpiB
MKIALIIENSQAAKSEIVHSALKSVAEPLGHHVHHYGMYTPEDKASLTYVMNGLLAGILLNSKAADFVVTGCGTGMGSMLACNSMPGVFCGLVADPTDAFLFGQINDPPSSTCRIATASCSSTSAASAIPRSARPSWPRTAAS